MLDTLNGYLTRMMEERGSDLHLQSDEVPRARIKGDITPLDFPPLSLADAEKLAEEIMSPAQYEDFRRDSEMDCAYACDGVGRFRVNVFRQRGKTGFVLRVIPVKILTVAELGIPSILTDVCEIERGMILVTGATGSGKSTTLAAMLDHLNATKEMHIMTIEDPIEFVHQNKKSLFNQREVGKDTPSFARALKAVLRQDPDVILIGELRDAETMSIAMTAAETGHIVFGTLHTIDAMQSIERILNTFPIEEVQQARMALSLSLEAIVCQRLVKRADGQGMVAAVEIMRSSPLVRKQILDGETKKLYNTIQNSQSLGMQTFNLHLAQLVGYGWITQEEALAASSRPDELKLNLQGIFTGVSGMG